jgi:hypothetical protein
MTNTNTHSFGLHYLTKKCQLTLVALLILIFSGISVAAQTDFRNGFYITLENDTVYGLVDYRGEVRNSQTCVFKKNEAAEPVKFDPAEIQAYRFTDGKFYISKQINTGTEEKTVFLEFLVNGITNLYFYRDINYYTYFIEDKNGKLLVLSNEKITSNVDGKGEVQRNSNKYIGVLKATFADCKEIQPQINNVSLGHKSLINITKNYHNYVCDTEECIVYEKKVSPAKVRFAPVLKTGVANFHFDKGIFSNYAFDPEVYFGGGFLMNTVFPGINEKLSFEAELDFNMYNFHGSYQEMNGAIIETYNVYLDLLSLQPTISVKYTFPTGKFRPTVAVGGYADIFVGNNQIVETEKQHPDTVYTYESYETPLTPLVFGGFAQLGCNYELAEHTFFTNVRFCYSTNQDQGIKNIITSVNLNVGMFLNKRR